MAKAYKCDSCKEFKEADESGLPASILGVRGDVKRIDLCLFCTENVLAFILNYREGKEVKESTKEQDEQYRKETKERAERAIAVATSFARSFNR